jgi:Sensors of blue-light using FAD
MDITGMLLYKEGNFMQCLDVPKEGVCALEAKIKSKLRHRGMIVLLSEEHAQREFNNGDGI